MTTLKDELYQLFFNVGLKRNVEITMVNAHIVIPSGRWQIEKALGTYELKAYSDFKSALHVKKFLKL